MGPHIELGSVSTAKQPLELAPQGGTTFQNLPRLRVPAMKMPMNDKIVVIRFRFIARTCGLYA